MKSEYLTKREVAERLRIGVRTLDRIVADGDLVAARVGGRRLLFRPQDVERYVDRQFSKAAQ